MIVCGNFGGHALKLQCHKQPLQRRHICWQFSVKDHLRLCIRRQDGCF